MKTFSPAALFENERTNELFDSRRDKLLVLTCDTEKNDGPSFVLLGLDHRCMLLENDTRRFVINRQRIFMHLCEV